ncbi:MAG: hypothetical protein ACREHD_26830 [Pirellulales bacterium]
MAQGRNRLFWILGSAFAIVGLFCAGSIVAVVVIAKKMSPSSGFPPPAGPPKLVYGIGINDDPISQNAKWVGDELEVRADQAGVQRLFEAPLERLDQSMLTYRFRIKTEDPTPSVYAEMWCRVEGFGEAFSRGLDQKVSGANNWVSVQIPFYLQKAQYADLLKLNLVFERPGTVRLREIEILATPLQGQ